MVWHSNHAPGVSQLIARLIGADMNSTNDQAIPWVAAGPNNNLFRYRIDSILVTNPSTSLTTAAGGVYTAASKSGVTIVASGQVYTALTAAATGLELTISAAGRSLLTAAPILSLTTGQGGAATADVYVFGRFVPTLPS